MLTTVIYNQNKEASNIISLVIISTNIKRRFGTLVNTINSFKKINIDNQYFDEIILSVDRLENYGPTLSDAEFVKFMTENEILAQDRIYFKKGEGMISNQCNGVGLSRGNIIIYSEDDIIIKKLPSRENIIKLTENGVICYNDDLLYPGNSVEEDINLYKQKEQHVKNNFFVSNDEFFYKKDKNRFSKEFSRYSSGRNLSVTFPCAIMKRHIFTKVYNDISKLNYSFHIEAAFSHVINTNNIDSYIFCNNDNIPLEVPWLYRDNSIEIEVSGETINRDLSQLKQLTNDNIDNYNNRNKNFYIQYFTKCIENKIPFSYSKYGDGEYFASIGNNGANCDGDIYSKKLTQTINSSFKNIKPNKFYGLWHEFNNSYTINSDKKKYWENQVDILVNWVDYHIFIYNWSDKTYDSNLHRDIMYETIKNSRLKKIYVCNNLLVKSKDLLNIDELIYIPLRNFFDTEYDNLKQNILDKMGDDMCIIMFSTGMSAKCFISELSDLKPNNIYLDIGSGLDEICTKFNSRGINIITQI